MRTITLVFLGVTCLSCQAQPVDADGDGVFSDVDCNDQDPRIVPGANEVCDGVDNNCDGQVDRNASDAITVFLDSDADGHGDERRPVVICQAPEDHVLSADDCDDQDAAVHPGASEICDGVDNDCDGTTDEPGAVGETRFYVDADGDLFGDPADATSACGVPDGHVSNSDDCDDTLTAVHPGADELCDHLDNDCDGQIDGERSLDTTVSYWDSDGDGHGDPRIAWVSCTPDPAHVLIGDDCDDADPERFPLAAPACDGRDLDCDGLVDSDADNDGLADASCGGSDCDDAVQELGLNCGVFVNATLGDDANLGRLPSLPLASLTAALSVISSGESMFLARGQLWREELRLTHSNLRVAAYGEGAPPVLSGADLIGGWSSDGNGIWTTPLLPPIMQIFIENKRQLLAREPDNGEWRFAHYVNGTLSDTNLSLLPSPVGAQILLKTEPWSVERRVVTGFDPATGVIELDRALVWGNQTTEIGYFLEGLPWMLSTAGEWVQSEGVLSLRTDGDPTQLAVEGSVRPNVVYARDLDTLALSGLTLDKAGEDALYLHGVVHGEIADVRVTSAGNSGAHLTACGGDPSQPFLLDSLDIDDSWRRGIEIVQSDGIRVSNSLIQRSFLNETDGFPAAIDVDRGSGVTVRGCDVINSGYHGIRVTGQGHQVLGNRVIDPMQTLADGGGIYTWGDYSYDILIAGNRVSGVMGQGAGLADLGRISAQGIYLDDHTHDIEVQDNTVWNVRDSALMLHNGYGHRVSGNQLLGGSSALLLAHDTIVSANAPVGGYDVRDNSLFVSGSPNGPTSAIDIRSSYDELDQATYFQNAIWTPSDLAPVRASWVAVGLGVQRRSWFNLLRWQDTVLFPSDDIDLRPNYEVITEQITLTGDSPWANGQFNTDLSGFSGWPNTVQRSWQADCGWSGGCLAVTDGATPYSSSSQALSSPIVNLISGQAYVVEFDAQSDQPDDLFLQVMRAAAPYDSPVPLFYFNTNSDWAHYRWVMRPEYDVPARLFIKRGAQNTTWRFDNITLRTADVNENDPTDDLYVLFNDDRSRGQDVATPAGLWCDTTGAPVGETRPLPAFSAEVLFACGCNNDAVCNNLEDALTCPADCG